MRKITDKLRRINPFARKNDGPLPRPPSTTAQNMVKNFQETVKIYEQGKKYYDCLLYTSLPHEVVHEERLAAARRTQYELVAVGGDAGLHRQVADVEVQGLPPRAGTA